MSDFFISKNQSLENYLREIGEVRLLTPDEEIDLAQRIKDAVNCTVISVGGFRSMEVIEDVLKNEQADCISMSRPLIREPDLPKRWAGGDRSKATCISCNSCFLPGLKEGGIYCVVDKKEKEKSQ